MSLDKLHEQILDYVNVIYMVNHNEAQKIKNYRLSTSGTVRPFLNSFMKIHNYQNSVYSEILQKVTTLTKSNSYVICDKDYNHAVELGIIPDGKEELDQTVELLIEE